MFDSPFTSYAYSYPHKSAYRPIDPPIAMADAWSMQDTSALFLYLHVPFCEYRCGFCNLFTLAQPAEDWPLNYLEVMRRQAEVVRECVTDARFARLAVGGGTPTFLKPNELACLLSIIADTMRADGTSLPAGIEGSPGTIDEAKLRLLKDFGFDRISLGVQSFDSSELKSIGRPQRADDVARAVGLVRRFDFPTLNLDLIYGAEGQTVDSWMSSVRRAVELEPEEIYLYPLYVRPLTGLGRTSHLGNESAQRSQWDHQRRQLYRVARDYLRTRGYRQVSMRMFASPAAPHVDSPAYCCQSDGMIGLGCGARSYTDTLHYSFEYAVGAAEVRRILRDYLNRDTASFRQIEFGYELDLDDRQRRFLILSLLQCEGMKRSAYFDQFGTDPLVDFPNLALLSEHGLLEIQPHALRLTETGIEHSDAIGPWLNSPKVQQRIEQ